MKITIKFGKHEKELYDRIRQYCYERSLTLNMCLKLIIRNHLEKTKMKKRIWEKIKKLLSNT